MPKARTLLSLAGFTALTGGVAWWASRKSPQSLDTREWYEQLRKPAFNPPDAVFPVVWSALYVLIALSGWRVWTAGDADRRKRALLLWGIQMALNAGWTEFFFGTRSPRWALADVLVLEATIIAYILEAKKVDKLASGCFVPYACWVAFASLLNAEIVRRNPGSPTPG